MSVRNPYWSNLISLFVGTSFVLFVSVSKADLPNEVEASAKSIDTLAIDPFPLLSARPESDGLRLRRLSLDLRMVAPTLAELEEFQSDRSEDRWQRWVDRFLSDPLHRERMVDWLDKTFMQRRPNKYVDRAKWLSYLRQTVDDRKPIDALAKELVSSVWWNSSERAQQRFFLDREGDPHGIARDVGRIFFGCDLQCAQCHDHPQINDYLQIDYHGLLGFFSPSGLVEAKYKDDKGAEQKQQMYVERAATDANFESVFDKGVVFRSGARLPGGAERIEPYSAPDDRYLAKHRSDSMEGVPMPPKTSRRDALVDELTVQNEIFARNWANRIWAMMMGRGIVHPLDMYHADNPPVHPELLQHLTQELIALKFDMRSLVRQIALSKTYQRSSVLPIESFLQKQSVIRLDAEVSKGLGQEVIDSLKSLDSQSAPLSEQCDQLRQSMDDARSQWRNFQKDRVAVRAELDKLETKFNEMKKKLDDANNQLAKATKTRDDLVSKTKLLEQASKDLEQAKSLTPGGDKELDQAIATSKSKAEASKNGLPPAEKAVTDATAARDNHAAALETERGPMLEVAKRMGPIESGLQGADREFLKQRRLWQAAQMEWTRCRNKIASLTRFQKWLEESNRVFDLEEQRSKIDVELSVLQKELQSMQVQSESLTQQRGRVVAVHASIDQEYKVANEGIQKVNSEIETLRTAHVSIEKAVAILESRDSFILAVQTIEQSQKTRLSLQESLLQSAAKISERLQEQSLKIAGIDADRATISDKISETTMSIERLRLRDQEMIAMVESAVLSCAKLHQQVMEDRQREFQLAQGRSLSPEQLGWSILRATKVLDNYISAEIAAMEKEAPLPADATDAIRDERKAKATWQAMDKLRGNVDVFSNLYASGVGQSADEFFASPDQALFMSNGGSVFPWSAPSSNNVSDLVAKQPDTHEAARILYRSMLSRDPTQSEQQWVVQLLEQNASNKNPIAQELVWGLLTSSEFRVFP